jgi:tRNA (guanine37-N1)-methyltransferase
MIFDESVFDISEEIPAVKVPAKLVGKLLKHERIEKHILSRSGFKTVHTSPDIGKEYRVVLLSDKLPADLLDLFEGEETTFMLTSGYRDLNTEESLRRLLPDVTELPSSFETIGHIAHMNLREEFQPHKELIGQVILDKNPHIETVITKIGTLANEFRTFDKEIIASRKGNNSLVASVSENKMRLKVDYERCYWNSRLSTERMRLLKLFSSSDFAKSRLIDMCCGVGALACFAAKEGIEVYANDLNPWAVACARDNALKNKVDVETFNTDGREFVRSLVKSGKLAESKINHVMINLPEIGLSFLDVFAGLFNTQEELNSNVFRIYCHCFSREKPPKDCRTRTLAALGLDEQFEGRLALLKDELEISTVFVRDVSPNKIMYCVEFTVPDEILLANNVPKKVRADFS